MHDQPVNRQRLLETFLELVQINATSRRERAMADYMTKALAELGLEVVTDHAAQQLGGDTDNMIARLPGTIDAAPLLLCAHIDTVAPTEGITVCREDGVIKTDGTTILGADDRAGVAAILEVLRTLQESGIPHPPIEVLFTVAEEIGVMGSMVLDYSLLTARYGFVPDTSGPVGAIVTRAPAQKHLCISVQGKAAHAGMAPEQGISAIVVASRAIARMKLGRVDEETTANIGTIHGGTATNIVAEHVQIEAEARSRDPRKLDAQIEHMRACFEEAAQEAGATATVEVSDVYPAFNLSEDSPVVHLASAALADLDITPKITATGGGSDANFLNGQGIQSVILSTGYHNPHCCNEYIEEEQFVLLARWLYNIIALAGRA